MVEGVANTPESFNFKPLVSKKLAMSFMVVVAPGPIAQVAQAMLAVEPPSEPAPPPVSGLVTGTEMLELANAALGTAT